MATVVFDVNETLLDLRALRGPFREAFGSAEPMGEWFARLLHASVVANQLDRYEPFGTLGELALDALARRRGVALDPQQRTAILATMLVLPPHDDVVSGLGRFADAGWRIAALTNSAPDAAEAQLSNAGIRQSFDVVMSVEPSGRFKPHPAPYQMAAEQLSTEPHELWMIAAHDWDIAGAMQSGWRGAFLARPPAVYSSALPAPHVTAATVGDLADLIA